MLIYTASKSPGTGHNFPGKALRQAQADNSPDYSPTSASTESKAPELEQLSTVLQSLSFPGPEPSTGRNTSHSKLSSRTGATSPTSATKSSDRYEGQHKYRQQQFTDFSVSSLDRAEEKARDDKFKRILGANPVNLGELF